MKKGLFLRTVLLAGETRFEHATSGFGDRCSTIEPLPCDNMHKFIGVFATCQVECYYELVFYININNKNPTLSTNPTTENIKVARFHFVLSVFLFNIVNNFKINIMANHKSSKKTA